MDEAVAPGQLEHWAELNTRFHLEIGAMPGLRMLHETTARVLDTWHRVRRFYFKGVLQQRVAQAQQEHRDMLAAMRSARLRGARGRRTSAQPGRVGGLPRLPRSRRGLHRKGAHRGSTLMTRSHPHQLSIGCRVNDGTPDVSGGAMAPGVNGSCVVRRRCVLLALSAGTAGSRLPPISERPDGPGADTIAALQHAFATPPDNAAPMMRWWWFGPSVTHDELEREMRAMKAGGIGGVRGPAGVPAGARR